MLGPFKNERDPLFEGVPEWLSTEHPEKVPRPFSPFSESHFGSRLEGLFQAISLVMELFPHGEQLMGKWNITSEEYEALRTFRQKIHKVLTDERELRQQQDLILRSLHPNGCYFPHLSDEVKKHAFSLGNVDPIKGVYGLPFGYHNETLYCVFSYLKTQIDEIRFNTPSY